jgi:iron complex outermembrane receptor protein
MRRTNRWTGVLWVALSGTWIVPGAQSQEAAPPTDDDPVEEIVITGSRIRQSEQNFANPVTTFSSDALVQSGKTDLADFLAQSPALVGSITGDLTAGSNPGFGEVGLNLLDLRHLGVDRTLVLVDGRRHVSGLAGSAAVDVDAIPTDLLEAVDVLTGGASAIYGADGVSGVVNFRLRKDFEGLAFRGQLSQSSQGDGDNRFAALTAGTNFAEGRGNVALAYEYNADDRVFDQDRDFRSPLRSFNLYQNQSDLDDDPDVLDLSSYNDVRYADSSPVGAVDVDFDLLSDFEGNGNVYDRGFVLENSGGYTQGGSSTPVDGYQGDLFPEVDRHLVNLLGHFDVSDSLTLSAEAKYVRTRAMSVAQPSFDFYLLMTPDNPFMPDEIRDAIVPGAAAAFFEDPATPDGVLLTRDNYDLGTNAEDTLRETLRGVLAASGELSDHLRYEASYVYGETRSRIVELNNRFEDRWLAAVDVVADPMGGAPVCRSSLDPDADELLDGCVPYNIFGSGLRDPAAADWVNADSVSHSKVTQQVVSGSMSGDFGERLELPGGSIGFAFGAEYRRETSDSVPAQEIQDGLTWVGPITPSEGSFDVKELFAEVNLPVMANERFAHRLSFGAAFRASDYSTVGQTNSWKVDAVYAPVSALTFRGTYAQAVRAPNIAELFSPESSSFNFIVDPCDINETNNGTSTRAANCAQLLEELGIDPTTFLPSDTPQASVFTEGIFGGNRDLSEETATTWTAGVVLRPESAPGLSVALDWYDIEIEDAINTPEAEELAELCVDQPTLDNPFCAGIDRDPITGFITGFTARPDNVASFRTTGLDLALNYAMATGQGDFSVQLVGGYLDRLEFISSPGAEIDADLEEQYYPRFSATLDTSFRRGPLTIAYGINWHGKTDRFTRETLAGDPDFAAARFLRVKEKWDHEISASYDVTDQINIYGGINNLFDQKPAYGYTSYPISAMGQYFYLGARMNFGAGR